MAQKVNLTIKGYELRERVGAGGFGAVYRAIQPSVEREVAIKVILPQLANQPDFVRRFEVEAQMIARLEHPHIVPLYDYWRDPEGAYLVMRWLKGNLRQSIEKGVWGLPATARLLEQLASALTVAHREGIIHRDIKPENILLDEDSNAYLADFGIAKDTHLIGEPLEDDRLMGSPAYLSPEQIRSEAVNARSDIYSLGYVVYEMLVGEKPFPDAKSPSDYIQRHLSSSLPMMSIRHSSIPAAVDEVLQTATAKVPSHRYPSVLRFAAAFRAAIPTQQPRIPSQPLADGLTEREIDVLKLMVDGLSNGEISDRLVLSPTTIKWYSRQIYSKLDVHSRQQAVERALLMNLTQRPTYAPSMSPKQAEDHTPWHAIDAKIPFVEPENPYKGLRSFQEADATDFFGRAALTERLLSRLSEAGDDARFLVIVGPSGSGKSSIVRAGLIPALRSGALEMSPHPFVADFLPGTHPLEELEAALLRVAINPIPGLLEQLSDDRRGLVRAARRVLPNDVQTELILVIDQFEEVFTLVSDEAVRMHFIDNLLSAATDPRGRVRIILTLRADFYDRPLLYPRLAELIRANTEVIVPLTARELEQAITAPADRVGVKFEAGLVTTIIEEVGEQPGTLPLLQYALTELFERREGLSLTLDAYRETGGVLGALARRAEEIYNSLDLKAQQVTKQLFLRLVTLGEGADDTRRRTGMQELSTVGNDGEMEEVIDAFALYRLLTLDHDPLTRNPTVEIAHEALLREWRRLRDWLVSYREDIRTQRRLSQAAAEWNDGNDNSFLALGSRLEQFASWATETELILTTEEHAYLDASLAERARYHQMEKGREAHEFALQQRSRTFLRMLVVVLIVALLGAIGLAGAAITQGNIAQVERDNAQVNFRRAEAQRLAAESNGVLAQNGSAEVAALLAIRSLSLLYTPQGDEALTAASLRDYPEQVFTGHTDRVKAVDYSPDGRYVLTGSGDSTVRLWDASTGRELRQFSGDMQDINSAVFSPDGQFILTGSRQDHTVRLWDVETGEELRRFSEGNGGAFSLNGERIFLFSENSQSSVMIDLATGETLHTIAAPQLWRRPETTGYSPDGTLYADVPEDEAVIRIRTIDGDHEILSIPRSSTFQNLAFSSDNRYFAVNGEDHTVQVWNIDSGVLIHELPQVGEAISMAFSPDNDLLATSDDRTVRVWDVQTGREIRQFNGHTLVVRNVHFSPDGKYVLSGSFDQRALLWEISPSEALPTLYDENHDVTSIAASPDGALIAGGRSDGTVVVWSTRNGSVERTIQAGTDAVWIIEFVNNGQMVTVSDSVRLWDVESGSVVREFPAIDPNAINIFDASSGYLLAADGANEVWTGGNILWSLATGEEVRRYTTPTTSTFALISPDQKYVVAYTNADRFYRLFDLETGEELQNFLSLKNLSGGHLIDISSDNLTLFTGGTTLSSFWNIETGEQLHGIIGPRDQVAAAHFSHDDGFVVTSSDDNTVRLWDTETGREVRRIAFQFAPSDTSFSVDDSFLIVLGSDERIHLISTQIEDTVETLCLRLLRNFTPEEREQYTISDNSPTCIEPAVIGVGFPPIQTSHG